jgi:uncharacterized protein (DUF697 family)
MGRTDTSRSHVNRSALLGGALGLLPFRFAAPAIAALGLKMLKDVREAFEAESSPVEQAVAAAVLGAGEFALGQTVRVVRLVPWVGPVLSGVFTAAAFKALGEGAIAYYQWSRHEREAPPRTPTTPGEGTRVSF